jgi:DUF1365 family protein
MYLWHTDLDRLPRLPWWLRPFARFNARGHFAPGAGGTIRSKLDGWLAHRGVDLRVGPVAMPAFARVLGYVFNPITVYWCRADDKSTMDKEFYVSPFQEQDGEYRMRLPRPEAQLDLTVALHRGETTPLVATLRRVRRPVDPRSLTRAVLGRPLQPRRVSALIRRHGITLWRRKAAIAARTPSNSGGQLNG